MKRHSGTWKDKLNAEDILENGNTLIGPFNKLSTQDFEDHVRKTHDIDYRRALDWMNAARRFTDKSELIAGLTEAVIRRLSAPSLTIADVEQIVSDIRAGKIKSDYRSVEQAIRNLKAEKSIQEKFSSQVLIAPSFTPNEPLPQLDLEVLKRTAQFNKIEAERKLSALQVKKDRLKEEMIILETEEKQLQAYVDKFAKQLQAYTLLLESQ